MFSLQFQKKYTILLRIRENKYTHGDYSIKILIQYIKLKNKKTNIKLQAG